jgi:hypothetical protein
MCHKKSCGGGFAVEWKCTLGAEEGWQRWLTDLYLHIGIAVRLSNLDPLVSTLMGYIPNIARLMILLSCGDVSWPTPLVMAAECCRVETAYSILL